MKLIIKRIYHRDNCTIGCVQVYFSRKYKSRYVVKEIPYCDTIELHSSNEANTRASVPEGTYRVIIRDSKTFKRKMPVVVGIPGIKHVMIRSGKTSYQLSRGDIIVGHLGYVPNGHPTDDPHLEKTSQTFRELFCLIEEAISYGENVWVVIR